MPKVCPNGSVLNAGTGQCVVPPVPNTSGSGTSLGLKCPIGTTEVKTGDVIVGCTADAVCKPCDKGYTFDNALKVCVPKVAGGAISLYIDTTFPNAPATVAQKICKNKTSLVPFPSGTCYAFDSRQEQPDCYGKNKCYRASDLTIEGGNMKDTLDILTGKGPYSTLHLLPPTVQANIIPITTLDYNTLRTIAADTSPFVLIASNQLDDDWREGLSGPYNYKNKTYCALISSRVNVSVNGQPCEPINMLQAISQHNVNTSMFVFSPYPRSALNINVTSPIAFFGGSVGAIITQLTDQDIGIFRRAMQ